MSFNISNNNLRNADPEVFSALIKEVDRLQTHLELIPSENAVSRAIMQAQGSVFTLKYAEGYPGKRYYGGCENVDVIENLAIERLKKIFSVDGVALHANVQPHSGSQANAAVYQAALKPGDTILTMRLSDGGHLTHGHPKNFSGVFYKIEHYGVDETTGQIDYDKLEAQALALRPQMITVGASAYPRVINFKRMGEIAKKSGALMLADIAHIAGLIAAGVHPTPVGHADFITSTTHKTLRGPRGGIILCEEKWAKAIDSAVFPGQQGGPLMHVIAAKAVCFAEALTPAFKDYQHQIIKNSKALAEAFIKRGYKLLSGGTDNHLLLIDLRHSHPTLDGLDAQKALEAAHITTNRNTIPGETRSPFRPSGLRMGTPVVTSRGMKEAEMETIASFIDRVLSAPADALLAQKIAGEVADLCKKFPLPYSAE
jgi:glycine hydroxymethyltransferase